MIPKIIHYCWFGPKPFPKLVIKCMNTWKIYFPEYEFCLWNEYNSPMDVHFVQEAYKAGKYAFVADYVRFWALNQYGGIYLDTDMYMVKSINDLMSKKCFFAWETTEKNAIGCCVIGAEASTPFINSLLDKYHNLHFDPESIDKFVIPRLITPLYSSIQFPEVEILPYDYFYAFPYEKRDAGNFEKYKTANTYGYHLWNLSWVSFSSKIFSSVVMRIKKILKR